MSGYVGFAIYQITAQITKEIDQIRAGLKAAGGWQLQPWSNCTKGYSVAHIVAEPCFGCKYTDCVVVCPVECFYEGEEMLYIAPEECIDCEACVPECPVAAIFHEDNLPAEWADYKELNAELAKACPVITEKKDALGPPVE